MLLAATTLGACATQAPPPSPSSPRLADVLGAGAPTPSPAQVPPAPAGKATGSSATTTGAGAESPACGEARAQRTAVSARLAQVRQTAGVPEARALDRASAALSACEARQDCVEGDPKERAARVMAVEEARDAFRKANAALQQEELGLFEADRAVRAACGNAP